MLGKILRQQKILIPWIFQKLILFILLVILIGLSGIVIFNGDIKSYESIREAVFNRYILCIAFFPLTACANYWDIFLSLK